jgi:hypothetical protein
MSEKKLLGRLFLNFKSCNLQPEEAREELHSSLVVANDLDLDEEDENNEINQEQFGVSNSYDCTKRNVI